MDRDAVSQRLGHCPGHRLADRGVLRTAQPYEAFIAVTLLYVLINVTVMFLMRHVEQKVRVPGYVGGK